MGQLGTIVLATLDDESDADKSAIASLGRGDMIQYHHGFGTYIRNRFGLWRGNGELLASTGAEHPDDASQVILEQLNSYLKQNR